MAAPLSLQPAAGVGMTSDRTRRRMIERLRAILLTPELGRSPAYEAQSRRWREANAAMLARLIAESSPQQRRQLQRKLRDYASDALMLASNR